MNDLRYVRAEDEYFVSVPDLVRHFLEAHETLTGKGEHSPYEDLATWLSSPFMEMDGVQPGAALHTPPPGGAPDTQLPA
jgi:hypothetical protein